MLDHTNAATSSCDRCEADSFRSGHISRKLPRGLGGLGTLGAEPTVTMKSLSFSWSLSILVACYLAVLPSVAPTGYLKLET